MSSFSWVKSGYLALLTVSLSACAQSPAVSPVVVGPGLLSMPSTTKTLTSQVLYQFLLGEIAGQRGELKLSAEAYADLANRTRDARIAKRATEVALFARMSNLALKNARLWQELEPNSPKALQTLASLLVGSGRMTEAKPFLQSWLKTGKGGEVFMQMHGLLARQKDKQAVLDLVADLAAGFPSVAEARFSVAQAALQAGKSAKALSELDEAMRLKPGWAPVPLFKAQVLQQTQGEEAALTFFKGQYFLTLRNDKQGYVTKGSDGLHFDEIKPWTFDDGTDLGNYNTQQHWVTHSDGLFLVYTRRGANNDHIFRHRAPLFMAQVDPEKLCVIRETERILVPERGTRLGNFGITDISPNETWVTTSEWMQPKGVEKYGSDGSIFVARIFWDKPNLLFEGF